MQCRMVGSHRLTALYWQGGPPIEEADRLDSSLPIRFMKLFAKRKAAGIHEADKYVRNFASR